MVDKRSITYLAAKTLILSALVIVPLMVFGGLASLARGSTNGSLFLPLVYGGAAPTPTPSPTKIPSPTPSPTPTATPVPGELWTWVASARDDGDTTVVYAVIPGYCCELIGQKSSKTIYVQAVCPAEPTCEIFPAPPEIPPPFAWGDVEKLIYDASSKQVCSIQWPFNCKDVE